MMNFEMKACGVMDVVRPLLDLAIDDAFRIMERVRPHR